MNLRSKIENPAQPVILYEMIPPLEGSPAEHEEKLALVHELKGMVDAINIPEIREEARKGARTKRLPQRVEPRVFARSVSSCTGMETVINRVTVHDAAADQLRWLKQSHGDYGIRNLILVGGESHQTSYPGPNVPETAALAGDAGLDLFLGGITIPSRSQEAARIRKKYEKGLRFFTTQVLLDSNDIVDLIQSLNGLDVRIVLSFAPISDIKDVEFLRWLGADVPKNVEWSISKEADPAKSVEKTVTQASKILTDVFDNLPPHPPGLGLNLEEITRRNHKPARQMLDTLRSLYLQFVHTHYSGRTAAELRASR